MVTELFRRSPCGFRKGGYEKHMKTEEFKSGISQVIALAKN
jgi:hypothetical protein